MRLFLCSLILTILILPCETRAAFKSSRSATITEMPEIQLQDDVALPLPYSGAMILRPVFVSSDALIRDKSFPMGIGNLQDQGRQIFERQFTGHISAPFTRNDLPADWKLEKNRQGSWYFIGKYEVTRSQWHQIMDGLLPDGDKNPAYENNKTEDPSAPIANVSWPEVQEFLQKYNSWLIKNHPDKLPVFRETRNVGFLRLPTEAEWEYAARGGDKVPGEWLEQKDFPPFEQNRTLPDYAIYSSPRIVEKPYPVGSRLPNPLNIYDTAGNVREMVNGFFHMTIADMIDDKVIRRLHGGAGGLIAKGGSFTSTEEGVLPGAREEIPIYSLDGAVGARDLGFRVVLAGVNLQGGQRLTELKRENGASKPKGTPEKAVELNEGMSLREMVAALAGSANGKLKSDLERIGAKLDDQMTAEKSRTLKNLENTYRSLLYQAETLRSFAYRYVVTNKERDKIRALLEKQVDKKTQSELEAMLSRADGDLNDYLQSLEMGASYYKSILSSVYAQSREELDRLGKQVRSEYGGKGIFNEHMRQNVDILEQNLALVRKEGLDALQPRLILKSILPENHYRVLPAKTRG